MANENKNGQQVQVQKKAPTIVDSTLARINEMKALGNLNLPNDYSAPNALNAAWLILQEVKTMDKRPVLEACTKESIAYALLSMSLQGLNPMKRQCSFIAYGNKLTLQREYQGSIALAKRAGLKSIIANPIFEGDDFKFEVNPETGLKHIVSHTSSFENYGKDVKGAYAIIEMENGTRNVEVMSMPQIRNAWNQGATKGQSPAHKNFPDQMACKTVINRAVKTIINSSDDASLFEDDDTPVLDVKASHVQQVIEDNSNKEEIGFDDAEIVHAGQGGNVEAPPEYQHDGSTQTISENVQAEATGPGF